MHGGPAKRQLDSTARYLGTCGLLTSCDIHKHKVTAIDLGLGAESLARLPGGHGAGGLVGPPPLPSHCSMDSAHGGKRQELEGAVFVQDGESAPELHGLGAPGPFPFISGKPGAASACLTHEMQEAQGLGPQHLLAPAKML